MKQPGRGVLKTLLQGRGSCPARPASLADPGMEDRHSSRSYFWVFFQPPLPTIGPKLIPLLPTSPSSSLNPRRGKYHHYHVSLYQNTNSVSKTLTKNQGLACFSRKEEGGRRKERVPGEMYMAPHYSADLLRGGRSPSEDVMGLAQPSLHRFSGKAPHGEGVEVEHSGDSTSSTVSSGLSAVGELNYQHTLRGDTPAEMLQRHEEVKPGCPSKQWAEPGQAAVVSACSTPGGSVCTPRRRPEEKPAPPFRLGGSKGF